MIWLMLGSLAWGGTKPENCLEPVEGWEKDFTPDRDHPRPIIRLAMTFHNVCDDVVRGFAGYVTATSRSNPALTITFRVTGPDRRFDPFATDSFSNWQYLGTSDADVWLAAAPPSDVEFAWVPSLIVFKKYPPFQADRQIEAAKPTETTEVWQNL